MNIQPGDKVLVTTERWFVAPNGKQYRSAFGVIVGIHDDKQTLGIQTNRASTNWYLEIGNMIIAGCQIHYLVKTETVDFDAVEAVDKDGTKSSFIYNADN